MKVKLLKIIKDGLVFEDGILLSSKHSQECCEQHYLSTEDLTMEDFEGLLFDFSNDNFFERIDGYGIALNPVNGFPVRIPGYGYNNGWYSDELTLVLTKNGNIVNVYDITNCQVITD